MADMAPKLWGIPVVRTTAERDDLFPTPADNQRVQNLETGQRERWDGTAWVVDPGNAFTGVNALDPRYGVVADGSADDTDALAAAALAAAGQTLFLPPGNYRVTAAVPLPSSTLVVGSGDGSTITQATDNTEIFNIESKSDVVVRNVVFVGRSDYSASDSSRAVAVYGGTSGARNRVEGCTFTNFGYTPVRFKAQTDCAFVDNTVVGPGSPTLTSITSGANYGVLFDVGCDGVLIEGNSISGHAQGVMVQGSSSVRVANNRIFDITGQHGMYIGGALDKVTVTGNTVDNPDLIGIKVQVADLAPAGDGVAIVVANNAITDAGSHGIVLSNGSAPSATHKVLGASVTGNVIANAGEEGINVNSARGVAVVGNVIDTTGRSGISVSSTTTGIVSHNVIRKTANSAITDGAEANTDLTITDNRITDCATAAVSGDRYGIYLSQNGSGYAIDRNWISDADAKMDYGIFIASGDQSTMAVRDNIVTDAVQTGARFQSGTPFLAYSGNSFTGTVGAVANEPSYPSVASANTLTLPTASATVGITGTTTIQTIVAQGHTGNLVTLVFAASLTVKGAGFNVKLAGGSDFAATADDTLTLVCDGTNWREVCRSVNA